MRRSLPALPSVWRHNGFPVAVLVCFALATAAACAAVTPHPPEAAARTPARSLSFPERLPRVDVTAAVHAVLPAGTVGALVFDRVRGTALVALNADHQFRSASIVKLLIAIDALHRDPTNARTVHRMLIYSDDPIANELWVAGGGDSIVTSLSELIGLEATRPPTVPGMWGNTLLTANDVVAIYRHILLELPNAHRDLILQALADTAQQASDGWYQHFGIPDGIGRPWAIKQGWSNGVDDLVVHSTGLVGQDGRYVVVLLLQAEGTAGWAALRKAATAAAAELATIVTGDESNRRLC